MRNLSNLMGRRLSLALLSLLAVLAVGCGSSNNDFVVSGGGNNIFTTGSLSYLLRVNDVTSLPNGTTLLRFDLYDGNGNLILSSNATVSDVFEIDEVDGDVRSTTVTAFDEDGFPIGQVTVPSEVVLGADTDIDLSNAVFTPITFDALTATPDPAELGTDETLQLALQASFSNGATVVLPSASFPQSAAFVSNDTDVVTVNSAGVLTGGEAGNTTVSATYTINGVGRSDTVDASVTNLDVVATFISIRALLANEFDDFSVSVGGNLQPGYVARLTLPSGQVENISATELSFTFDPAVAGFSVSSSGEVSVAGTVALNTTANLRVSYTDGNGKTYSDIMVITAGGNG
ncbi:MAG: hypothetical protein KC800_10190 [Candidatus Eremiobacteraeota bacterium]|nr:hypothetical protein [Candidatus Eremiobacteraeota bacterium]